MLTHGLKWVENDVDKAHLRIYCGILVIRDLSCSSS